MKYPAAEAAGGVLPPGDFFGPQPGQPFRQSGNQYTMKFESILGPSAGNTSYRTAPQRPGAPGAFQLLAAQSCTAALLGHSSLTFDITSYVTRDGKQVAGSISGSEIWPAERHCSGSTFDYFEYATLSITGVAHGVSPPISLNSIASSLATPGQAFLADPLGDVLGALVTALAILFITFPAQLFNHTLQANYEEIRTWWERPLSYLKSLREDLEKRTGQHRELVTFGVVIALGALLDGFLDPMFGFNISSLLTFVSMVLALLVSIAVPNLAAYWYRRARHRPRDFHLQSLPAGLLVALLCVIVSRAASFEPGYLYGLVCGVAFGVKLSRVEDGHVAGLSSLGSLGVAVVAWLAWDPLHTAVVTPGTSFLLVLLTDLLAAVFVGGLVGNLVALLPLQFTPGGAVAKWHKGAWAGVYSVAVFGFVQTLLGPSSTVSSRGNAPLVTVLILFVGFGGGSVVFYEYFHRREVARERAGSAGPTKPEEDLLHRLWGQALIGVGRGSADTPSVTQNPDSEGG
jgi:hypothetical protein